MKKLFIAAAITMASLAVNAGELIVHIGSQHTEKQYEFDAGGVRNINNSNRGIGYRTDDGLTVGYYYNSYYANTVYVTQEFMYNKNVGVVLGAATGYRQASGLAVTPMVAALGKIQVTDDISINVLAMPKIGRFIGVAHVALAFKF